MTKVSMALIELAEKHGEGDFPRELRLWALQRLMEMEAETQCGAGLHERSSERVNHRNGYRLLDTAGSVLTASIQYPEPVGIQPPSAADDTAETDLDTPVVAGVLANDSGSDGDTLVVAAVTQPANGAVVVSAAQPLTYKPGPGSLARLPLPIRWMTSEEGRTRPR